jgi:hypothetical protein
MNSPIVASDGGVQRLANANESSPCGKKIPMYLILLGPDSFPELFYLNTAMAAAASVVAAKCKGF